MRKSKLTRKQKEYIAAYLFILPSFLGIAVFYIVPYIICFTKSLYVGDTFVGIENYIQLFQNNTFLLALKNTGIFTVTAIPLLMVISFLIALFLNSFNKISSFFRSALLIPVVVPIASLICVWQLVFDDYGAINGLLNSLGFNTVEFVWRLSKHQCVFFAELHQQQLLQSQLSKIVGGINCLIAVYNYCAVYFLLL